jgi:adenosine deaminase
MDLADLHRHLDGSLRPPTVQMLADALGLEVPSDLPFHAGMGLDAALARFGFTLSLLQTPESVRRVAAEICEDAAHEGVTTLEIRFAPQLHRGARPEAIVDAALDGIAGRAGLILCGLYGEDPAALLALVEVARTRPGVVGLDLAGGPTAAQSWSLADYVAPFTLARDLGIGRTVHAGEGRPPAEIRVAIEDLHAQRIGHGTTLLDDPSVLALIIDRQVLIEACPTSNWHTGVIPEIGAHPLPDWLDRGVRVCINTDNTLLSEVDAPTELQRAAAMPGMTPGKLSLLVQNGHAGAFRR